MMPKVTHEEVLKLFKQFNAVASLRFRIKDREESGLGSGFEILWNAITQKALPKPGKSGTVTLADGTEEPFNEPPVNVDIPQQVWDRLFSEKATDKSLWYQLNELLGRISIENAARINGSTGDELTVIQAKVDALPDGPKKVTATARLNALKSTDQAFSLEG